MDIQGWEQRYKSRGRAADDLTAPPTPLLVSFADMLPPAKALDLACGAGRNSLWLASRGWTVTAVDGSAAAIAALRDLAREQRLEVNARVADLERSGFPITPESWDLVAICYYLQRDLMEPAKEGVKPGGSILVIVHITENGEAPTKSRLRPGELAGYFTGWEILHSYEGKPNDPAHRRAVAEIVARRPG